MEELIEKVANLKKILNETEEIKQIKYLNKQIIQDKNLIELVKKYQTTKDEKLKQEILKNDLFKKYKEQETNINLIILQINQQLKKITNNSKGKCSSENN